MGMTWPWCCVDAEGIATTPSSSLAHLRCMLLCWGGRGEDDDNDDNLRVDDDDFDGRPCPPNTQQPAIEEGVETATATVMGWQW
jgi:hypothetical protein